MRHYDIENAKDYYIRSNFCIFCQNIASEPEGNFTTLSFLRTSQFD